MSIAVENLIISRLVKYLNDNKAAIGLPCIVKNNEKPATGEAMWIEPNPGQRVTQHFIGGSYKGQFPFTLCYQQTALENKTGRKASLDVPLYAVGAWFEGKDGEGVSGKPFVLELEELQEVRMKTQPYESNISEDQKTVEHSAVFEIEYVKKRYQ